MMNPADQIARATHFRDLNLAGHLLLPNAWNPASARIFEGAGFPAIGTTSGGIANTRGFPDAERIGRDAMVKEIAAIIAAVDLPVTADIEAGYGPRPEDVAETIDAIIDVGAAGVNLEDNTHGSAAEPLYGIDAQAARIAAARTASERRGIPLAINARTDTFILNLGHDLDERLAMTIERGRAYVEAGADVIFVPLLVDPAGVRHVASEIDAPINVMVIPGAPPAAELFAAGASRISLGAAAMLATLGTLRTIADEVATTGTWSAIERTFYGFGEAEALFVDR